MANQIIEQQVEAQAAQERGQMQFIVAEEWEWAGECSAAACEGQPEDAAWPADDEGDDWGWGCCVA